MSDEKTFTQAEIDEINTKHQEEMTALSARLNAENKRKTEAALKDLRTQLENEAK